MDDAFKPPDNPWRQRCKLDYALALLGPPVAACAVTFSMVAGAAQMPRCSDHPCLTDGQHATQISPDINIGGTIAYKTVFIAPL
jgi:hypothetical protein